VLVLVGLGNPETKYSMNRHNVGFMTIDSISKKYAFTTFKSKFQAHITKKQLSDKTVLLVKPQTFMNLSGQSLNQIKKFYKIENNNIIVIHDDLDLKIGDVRTKVGGGSGGHNGLKSIDSHIGNDYIRIRIGIDHPGNKDLVNKYVLSDFNNTDLVLISPLIDNICSNLKNIIENIDNLSITLSKTITRG
tara:strand:+ start:45 stop:614 length:570 start_codon:yes stop_codon:yes gene_type:complete